MTALHDDHLDVLGGAGGRQVLWRVPRSSVTRMDQQTIQELKVAGGGDSGNVWPRRMPGEQIIHLNGSRHQARIQGWEQPAN